MSDIEQTISGIAEKIQNKEDGEEMIEEIASGLLQN